MKRKALAVYLKLALIAVFVVLVAVFSFLAPEMGSQIKKLYPVFENLYYPCLIFVWVTAFPLFLAVGKGWQIVTEIGKDNTYCIANSRRLRVISRLILADVLLYCAALVATVVFELFHPAMYLFLTVLIFGGASASIVASAMSQYILRYRERNHIE